MGALLIKCTAAGFDPSVVEPSCSVTKGS